MASSHRFSEEYCVFVAQNFLRSITRPQVAQAPNPATHLQDDSSVALDNSRVQRTVGPSGSVEDDTYKETTPSLSLLLRRRSSTHSHRPRAGSSSLHLIHGGQEEEAELPLSKSFDSRRSRPLESTSSKLSLMLRFSRMLSQENLKSEGKRGDSSTSMADSPSSSQFSFLKRIRSTVGRCERQLLLTTSSLTPVVVSSLMPWSSKETPPPSTPTHSHPSHRADRIVNLLNVDGELQPLELHEDEEIAYGPLLCLRRRRGSTGEGRRQERQDSVCMLSTEVEEDPKGIAEVESVLRTALRLPGFLRSQRDFYSREEERKLLNHRFRVRYPDVRITWTKLRSIKREMLAVATREDLDACTVAHAFVYFDRLVLQGRVGKENRKDVAGAALVVATKMCDPPCLVIRGLVERLSATFRTSPSTLISYELPVCISLSFDLMPPRSVLLPYFTNIQIMLA